MELSALQRMWLQSRGGRDENDVYVSDDQLAVFMWNGKNHTENMVFIPDDIAIHLRMNEQGFVQDTR